MEEGGARQIQVLAENRSIVLVFQVSYIVSDREKTSVPKPDPKPWEICHNKTLFGKLCKYFESNYVVKRHYRWEIKRHGQEIDWEIRKQNAFYLAGVSEEKAHAQQWQLNHSVHGDASGVTNN